MISITDKIDTKRIAFARSCVLVQKETLDRLLVNDIPKKDILPIARAAGVMAAKKTPELLPYCHPIPIDSVQIEYCFLETSDDKRLIEIEVIVEAIWKTGVEMEALTAASVTALTIYDMLKPIDKDIEISNTRLISKKGGKSDFKAQLPKGFKAAVIVTSDGTFQGKRKDKSGRIIKDRLNDLGIIYDYQILPDDQFEIKAALNIHIENGFDLIITTGGTGLGPRDVTVEATKDVIDREVPGIMEAARGHGQRRTPYAMLSRGIVGQKGSSLIVNLPGSSKGVEESLDAIFPHLLHAYGMMRGGGHPSTSEKLQQNSVVSA